MKQTAVEWFAEKIGHNSLMALTEYNEILEQAKAMEEKNLKDAFVAGAGMGEMFNNENRCYVSDADKYLKITFKSE